MDDALTDRLIQELKEGDEIVRREAANRLGSIKSDKGLRALIEAFGDDSWLVREMAIESLLKIGDESGLALFLSVLKDKDARVRNSAVKILTGLGELAMDALAKSLEDEDDDTVRYSADCLGDIGNPKALVPLLGALSRSRGDSRYYIILALGKLRDSGAVDALLPCLDEDMWIQTAALEALGDIGDSRAVDKIINVMKDEFFLVAPASDALGKIGEIKAIPVLLDNLESDNEEILSSSVKALVRIKENNVGIEHKNFLPLNLKKEIVTRGLVTTLSSDDAEARAAAAVVLGWLKAEGTVKPLTKLLEDEDYDVSKKAGESLVQMGTASVESLVNFMDIPEKRARLLAIQVLEEIRDGRALDYALKTLDDEDEDIRLAAINLLGKLGDTQCAGRLFSFLDDPSEILRSAAVKAIAGAGLAEDDMRVLLSKIDRGSDNFDRSVAEIMGLLKVEEAKPALESLLLSSNNSVKQAAVFALAEIDGKGGVGSIPVMLLGSEDPVLRKAAAIVLGKLEDKRGVQPLLLTSQDSDPWVRYHSIQSLGMLKDKRAFPVLKKGLADQVGVVRIAALKALARISPEEVNAGLIGWEHEDDEDVRQTFLEMLLSVNDEASRELFICALKDKAWKVREAAVKGLASYNDGGSLELLKTMLDDENLFVKKAAMLSIETRENNAL